SSPQSSMPRPIVLGNGSLLLNLDPRGNIRDLFFPQVGKYNHLSGYKIRMGFWVDGEFAWEEEDGWMRVQKYREDTLVAETDLQHPRLGLKVQVTEGVLHERPAFVRRIEVTSTSDKARELRLFFTHDLRIAESDIGDTAFYNPFLDAMIHYKGPHWFLFGAKTTEGGILEYATGIKAFGGLEGTWRDAEDGHLSQNPIAQGSVDSTFSVRTRLEPQISTEIPYWMTAGANLDDVEQQHHELLQDGPIHHLEQTSKFWTAWVGNRSPEQAEILGPELDAHLRRSLLIIRTQCDDGGAVIAANDSDIMETNRANYCYMWPRDGAFVSSVLDRVGHRQVSRRFFEFCQRLLPHDWPVLMHKYGPDGSLGASWHPWIVDGHPEVPFQQDETALSLVALAEHHRAHGDIEFLDQMYERFVVPTADYMLDYRDPVTDLPLPSWDLWEERRGVHAFTVASVVAAFEASAELADALGEDGAARYRTAAQETREALGKHFFDQKRGVFFRRLVVKTSGVMEPDLTIDSAVLNIGLLGALPPDDERVIQSAKVVEQALSVHSEVGGIARYQGDYYFRVSDRYPGNPWFICTLWLAQTQILFAKALADLAEPRRWLEWAVHHSGSTGVMSEQLHPETGAALSVSPLTWSHAEYVKTALDYVEKAKALAAK
ncbi:MAG: glycoside hydrolase family 15 protein, partial [Fimbriimonadaceae bacterium]|nr:glycoside hydrolase family 15 protein [Fimbriimonadaceae bacterium]